MVIQSCLCPLWSSGLKCVMDGWPSVSLPLFLWPSLLLSWFHHDQPSVYSVTYTAVLRLTGIANSVWKWRQRQTEGDREWKFGQYSVFPLSLRPRRTVWLPFTWPQSAISRITGLTKGLVQSTIKIALTHKGWHECKNTHVSFLAFTRTHTHTHVFTLM